MPHATIVCFPVAFFYLKTFANKRKRRLLLRVSIQSFTSSFFCIEHTERMSEETRLSQKRKLKVDSLSPDRDCRTCTQTKYVDV